MIDSRGTPLKATALLACVVQFILLRAIVHALVPDASADGMVLTMLVAATLTAAELFIAASVFNIESMKFDWTLPATKIATVGLGLGYVLAIGLLIFHSADSRAAAEMQHQSDDTRAITRQAEHDAAAIDPATAKMIQDRAAARAR